MTAQHSGAQHGKQKAACFRNLRRPQARPDQHCKYNEKPVSATTSLHSNETKTIRERNITIHNLEGGNILQRKTIILQFNMNKALYRVLYLNMTQAILYGTFTEQKNKWNMIKHIYCWKKKDSEWGRGSTSAHTGMLLAVLEFKVISISPVSPSTALLTRKKISKQTSNHLVQFCTKVGGFPP